MDRRISRPQQCSDACEKVAFPPVEKLKCPVRCPQDNCFWVGEPSSLESHLKQKHGPCAIEEVDRHSPEYTHVLRTREFQEKVSSMHEKVGNDLAAVASSQTELYKREEKLKKSESNVWRINIMLKTPSEKNVTGDHKQQLKQDLTIAKQKRDMNAKKVARAENALKKANDRLSTHQRELHGLLSSSSKYETPVVKRSIVLSDESTATSVASLGQASSQHLQERSLTFNAERSEQECVASLGSSRQSSTSILHHVTFPVLSHEGATSTKNETEANHDAQIEKDNCPISTASTQDRFPPLVQPLSPNHRISLARPFSSSGSPKRHVYVTAGSPTRHRPNVQAATPAKPAKPQRKLRRSKSVPQKMRFDFNTKDSDNESP